MAARSIAIVNQKGGVGKTTTAVNLGAYLGLVARVLLIDMDPQANATASLGLDARLANPSTYEVLLGSASLADAVRPSGQPGLDLVTASARLAGAQVELVGADRWQDRLKRALPAVSDRYDV